MATTKIASTERTSARASLPSYRQSPRKVRLVADLVRGRAVESAMVELAHLDRRAAPIFRKLLASAIANAKTLGLDEKTLVVTEIRVDKGAMLKRHMPRAHGRAFPIHKHTSHIQVTLGQKVEKRAKGASSTSGATIEKKTPMKTVASLANKKSATAAKK